MVIPQRKVQRLTLSCGQETVELTGLTEGMIEEMRALARKGEPIPAEGPNGELWLFPEASTVLKWDTFEEPDPAAVQEVVRAIAGGRHYSAKVDPGAS